MTESGAGTDPRDLFFKRFEQLWEAADSPKPADIVEAARLDKTNGPKRISDWRNGKNVPHDQAEFNRVVGALINRVGRGKRLSGDSLYSTQAWVTWRREAEESPLPKPSAGGRQDRQDQRRDVAAGSEGRPLSFRLPRVVPHFTGRVDMLARLHAALSARRAGVITAAISGLGGVGKTQLAIAYVTAHYQEFEIVAWVRGDESRITELADLAVALGVPALGRTPPERASDVLQFLANTDRCWLLVLDNLPGPEALAGLPTSGHGRVLVTSRYRGYEAFGDELVLDVFHADTARKYLLARTGRTTNEGAAAAAVASALGCLPLALAHVGAYCATDTGIPFSEYLELLEGLPSHELFDTNPELFYEQSVASTWNTSIAAAEQQSPLARRALEMTAYLASDAIPRSFFSALEEDSPTGHKLVADALMALHRYSLATVAGKKVGVHPLLQKVIRDRLTVHESSSAARHARAAIQSAMPEDPEHPATWTQWQDLVPHITALAGIEPINLNAALLMTLLIPTCQFLLSTGSLVPALALASRGLVISANHLGPRHYFTLAAESMLGNVHWSAGQPEKTIAILEPIVGDYESIFGADHPNVLNARGNLAAAYLSLGRTGEAIVIQERVVADFERLRGTENPHTLIAWRNLAAAYMSAGRTVKAIEIKERLVADCTRVLGPKHPDTLTARANLASSYQSVGRTAEAIAVLEQVVSELEQILGPEHPDTLKARSHLGVSYQDAGRTDEAVAILEQVAVAFERVDGSGHPDSLIARGRVAAGYRLVGRVDDAIVILEQVTAAFEHVCGPGHRSTLTAKANLATLYRSRDRADEADILLETILPILERLLGPDHPDTIAIRADLASSYHLAGRASEAIAIQERIATDSERLLGFDHPDTLRVWGKFADWCQQAGRAQNVVALLERLVTSCERLSGPDNRNTLIAKANLATSYRTVGRTGNAIAILEEVAAGFARVVGPDHVDTLIVRSNLGGSYKEAGHIREAIATLEEVAAGFEQHGYRDHIGALGARADLGVSYCLAGLAEGITVLEQVVPDYERMLGVDHPDTVTVRNNLSMIKEVREGRDSKA